MLGGLCLVTGLGALAASRAFSSYAEVKPILEGQRQQLPVELRNADSAKWLAWARRRDYSIRARLDQGDLDSMVNLLLYGTSFTKQPRILMAHLTEASKAGVLRGRVDDLVAGARDPGNNERLVFLQHLLRNHGIDPENAREAGRFLYDNLLHVIQERKTLAERAAGAGYVGLPDDPASLLDRGSFFEGRGVSLDTGIIPDFLIEQTLRDLKQRGVLRDGQVARAAVIGPGLDFIDKNEESAYDYYPQQTVQPFALYDSLVRLKLANGNAPTVSILDISARVFEHVRHAREQAAKSKGYVVQLPRDVARPWPEALIAYWRSFGDQAGTAVAPLRLPEIFAGLEARAVRIRPDVVLACQPVDLDVILEHLDLTAENRFDLAIATNIFVYYDPFEQALALENVATMLKPGGLLLTNDRLPERPGGPMRLAGITVVSFDSLTERTRQSVGWYQKR